MISRLPATLWYLLIAGVAWWAWAVCAQRLPGDLLYFSSLTALTVAVVYTAVLVAELRGGPSRASTVARGACATYCIVVAVVHQVFASGDLSSLASLLRHAVVPALVVVDWIAVRRGGGRISPGVVVPWLVVPLLYIPLYTLNDRPGAPGRPIYGYLDTEDAGYWPKVCAFAGGFLLTGLVVWALRPGRARNAACAGAHSSS